MRPTIWGPKYWFILHTSSFRYPKNPSEEDKKYMRQFLYSLANLTLPCPVCRHHMKEYLDNPDNGLDSALNDGQEYVKFIWKFHNSVNKRTGKSEMSFSNFKNLYDSYETKTDFGISMEKYLPYVLGALIGGMLVYLMNNNIHRN
jgi:hypothetical protein